MFIMTIVDSFPDLIKINKVFKLKKQGRLSIIDRNTFTGRLFYSEVRKPEYPGRKDKLSITEQLKGQQNLQ